MQLNLILLVAICVVTAHGASDDQRKNAVNQPEHRVHRRSLDWSFDEDVDEVRRGEWDWGPSISDEDDSDSTTQSTTTSSTTQSTTKKIKKPKRAKKPKYAYDYDHDFAVIHGGSVEPNKLIEADITSTDSTTTPTTPSTTTIPTSKRPTSIPTMTSTATMSTSKSTPPAPTTNSTSTARQMASSTPKPYAIENRKPRKTLAAAYIERQYGYMDQFESQLSRSQFEMAYASLVELQRRIDPLLETLATLLGRECLILWPHMSFGTSTPDYCKTSKDAAEAQLVAFENHLLLSRSYREGAESVKDLTTKMHEKYAKAMKDSLKNLAHDGRPGQLVDLPTSLRAFPVPRIGTRKPSLMSPSGLTSFQDYDYNSREVLGPAAVE